MTDIIDVATQREDADRELAILNFQGKGGEPEQLICGGEVICIECDDPISSARLLAKPNAARCVECQAVHEFLTGA